MIDPQTTARFAYQISMWITVWGGGLSSHLKKILSHGEALSSLAVCKLCLSLCKLQSLQAIFATVCMVRS